LDCFNLKGRTAIIAGSGALPFAVAKRLDGAGSPPFLVLLRGDADDALRRYEHDEISIVQLAKLVRILKKHQTRNVVLAGGVAKRPNLRDLRLDWTTLKALPYIFKALKQGDDALLRAFIRIMEGYGFRIIGAHEIVPDLLTSKVKIFSRKKPDKSDRADIAAAAEAAKILGRLDIGQGAVAVRGRVVALEGAEGTDSMLDRVRILRQAGKIPPKGGVLVKIKKPQQEMRADLPAIGLQTIENAHRAGLSGIAVEAGSSFIFDAEKVTEQADKYGLFLESL